MSEYQKVMDALAEPTIEQMEALPNGTEVSVIMPLQDGSGITLDNFIWDNEARIVAREHAKVCGSLHIIFVVYVLPQADIPDLIPDDLVKKGH